MVHKYLIEMCGFVKFVLAMLTFALVYLMRFENYKKKANFCLFQTLLRNKTKNSLEALKSSHLRLVAFVDGLRSRMQLLLSHQIAIFYKLEIGMEKYLLA